MSRSLGSRSPGAEVRGAEVRGTEVRGAEVRGAEVRGAEVRGAEVGAEVGSRSLGSRSLGSRSLGSRSLGSRSLGSRSLENNDPVAKKGELKKMVPIRRTLASKNHRKNPTERNPTPTESRVTDRKMEIGMARAGLMNQRLAMTARFQKNRAVQTAMTIPLNKNEKGSLKIRKKRLSA